MHAFRIFCSKNSRDVILNILFPKSYSRNFGTCFGNLKLTFIKSKIVILKFRGAQRKCGDAKRKKPSLNALQFFGVPDSVLD